MFRRGSRPIDGGRQFFVEVPPGVGPSEIMGRADAISQPNYTVTADPVRRRLRRVQLMCVTIKSPYLARLSRNPSMPGSLSNHWVYAKWVCGYYGDTPPNAPKS